MLFDIFSKRQKRLRGEAPDVYQYADLPSSFRAQVVHILLDLFGDPRAIQSRSLVLFGIVRNGLCREFGRFSLTDRHSRSVDEDLINFFLTTSDVEEALSVIELAFQTASYAHANDWEFRRFSNPRMTVDDGTSELNARFREHGIGFQFESNEIVRVDSQVLHEDVVKPALYLLHQKRFAGANGEFLRAHEHYRHADIRKRSTNV
jgi:hypothetical protein